MPRRDTRPRSPDGFLDREYGLELADERIQEKKNELATGAYLVKRAEERRSGWDSEKSDRVTENVLDALVELTERAKVFDPTEAIKCPNCSVKVYVETLPALAKALVSFAKVPDILVRLRPVAERQTDGDLVVDDLSMMAVSVSLTHQEMEALTQVERDDVVFLMTALARYKT